MTLDLRINGFTLILATSPPLGLLKNSAGSCGDLKQECPLLPVHLNASFCDIAVAKSINKSRKLVN